MNQLLYLQDSVNIEIAVEANPSKSKKMNWNDALAKAESMKMRLPSRLESMAIVDAIQKGNIDKKTFPDKWWTSEEYTKANAWSIIHDGTTRQDYKYDEIDVVLVRDISSSFPQYEETVARGMVMKLRAMGYEVTCTKTQTITL